MFNYEYFLFTGIGLVFTIHRTRKSGRKYLFLLIPTFIPFVNFLMVCSLVLESLFFGYAKCLGCNTDYVTNQRKTKNETYKSTRKTSVTRIEYDLPNR